LSYKYQKYASVRTVVALLSLVAVPEVLLFLHGTESAVDLNVQTSATSSVGHSQECTSSTLFNTFAYNSIIIGEKLIQGCLDVVIAM
jgi:hypothetical protein